MDRNIGAQPGNLSSDPLDDQFSSENPLLGMRIQQPFLPFTSPPSNAAPAPPPTNIPHMDWNPGTMIDNLTFIEEKIRQVKDVIRRSMLDDGGQLSAQLTQQQQQQVVNAELTCTIVQLISTAGSLLPSLKNSSFLSHSPAGQMASLVGSSSLSSVPSTTVSEMKTLEVMGSVPEYYDELFKESSLADGAVEGFDIGNVVVEEHGTNHGNEELILRPGSYELLQLEEDEIMAPHTHFCSVCGKGFKRDANLRMHMRGHGDEYKTPAALSKPPAPRDDAGAAAAVKRYSCPVSGCKRNKLHGSFKPLKTILCVKNHYKRSHCEKKQTCSRCHVKKFSIVADLRTHEKHCGRVKWLCSCGTSFSRKDKLFAHVALFHGHTPALPTEDSGQVASPVSMGGGGFVWGDSSGKAVDDDARGLDDDDFLSTANFGALDFSFAQFDPSDGSLAMPPPSEHYISAMHNL